ncbi:MAG: hypothetical protein U0869_10885 [Chloroflexota bacterium]
MTARWTPTQAGRVTRKNAPGPIASFLAGALTFAMFTFVLLVAAAVMIPGSFASGHDPDTARAGGGPTPTPSPSTGAVLPGAPVPFVPDPAAAPSPSPAPATSADPADPAGPATDGETGTADAPVTAVITGDPARLTLGGQEVAEVRVEALRSNAKPGITLGKDRRLLVATVRVGARQPVRYDPSDWQLIDADGRRWAALPKAPVDPLGAGTLPADREVSGMVAFSVPRDKGVQGLVLTDGAGNDLVRFDRAQPAS